MARADGIWPWSNHHAKSDANTANATDDKTASPAPDGIRRLHLVFRGEVQGVGFRWTASRCATQTGCTGWVRNEPDWETVTMELQGTQEQISTFFATFTKAWSRYPIEYVIDEKNDIPPVKGDSQFKVRY
jgi:acylphosphatase